MNCTDNCADNCTECNCEQSTPEKDGGDSLNRDWKPIEKTEKNEYRKESVVSQKEDKIDEMVNAHWSYIEKVIKSAAAARMFTLKEVMEMREFDYKSAARHFYGHGYEDGTLEMAKKTVERLKA